tara:strand:- start:1411 stop:1536 length:126 start_codon:yes stop_codon:yes gene_type:complete
MKLFNRLRPPMKKETKDTIYFFVQITLLLIIALAVEYIIYR